MQVVAHLVSVVGTHGDGGFPLLLQLQQGPHDAVHIDIAFQVVGFVEVALLIPPGAPQMYEIYPRAKFVHHADQIVIGPDAQGTCTEAQPVRGVGYGFYQLPEVFGRAHDTGQAQDGIGRVVRMNHQLDTRFVCHRGYLLQEIDQVRTQLVGVDLGILIQGQTELLDGKALFRTRQTGYHVAGKQLFLLLAHPEETGQGPNLFLLGIFLLRPGSFQDKEVEGQECVPLESQRPRTVGHLIGQISTCPVEYRHEIVGYHIDAAGGQVLQALFIIFDITFKAGRLGLDGFVYGNTLHHTPLQTGLGNERLPFLNLFDTPNLSVGDVVQGVYNIGGSGLPDVGQADGIVRPVPTPRLFT